MCRRASNNVLICITQSQKCTRGNACIYYRLVWIQRWHNMRGTVAGTLFFLSMEPILDRTYCEFWKVKVGGGSMHFTKCPSSWGCFYKARQCDIGTEITYQRLHRRRHYFVAYSYKPHISTRSSVDHKPRHCSALYTNTQNSSKFKFI